MAKKRLLSEAAVRRFMGLAGMGTEIVSSAINEMAGIYEEEPVVDDELPPEPAGEEPMGLDATEPAGEETPTTDEPMDGDTDVELTPEDVEKLKALKVAAMDAGEVVDKLDAAASGEEAELSDDVPVEEPVDAPVEDPAVADAGEIAPGEEEEEVMEALAGINLELSEDELVQEVAKRVAKRLLRAKKAQENLNEALGRKKK